MTRRIFIGARLFDGRSFQDGRAVLVEDGVVAGIVAADALTPRRDDTVIQLAGGVLAPSFVDLQVNGGAGLMIDGTLTLSSLQTICATHLALGSAGILPTLITDTAQAIDRVIAVGISASQARMPGFLGLHIEGPHLDPRRKGAHDPALIRPMGEDDLIKLCRAAEVLPALMVTLAPENATDAQISALAKAGAIVSLGHSDCSYATARRAMNAGANCVTHLFNAMSQFDKREPGLVGAALDGPACAGLIADGIHVDPAAMRIALAAKPEGIFLISDCMAFAGSDLREITLNGRRILRNAGRLTLEDGTLAGADLTMPQAIKTLIEAAAIAPERALAMASAIPAKLIRADDCNGHIAVGRAANFVRLDAQWNAAGVWHQGQRLLA